MPQASARSTWARQLAQDLAVVGVLPQVFERAGKSALAGLQRRGMGDRTPAVAAVLGVEREVDADVVAGPCAVGRVAGPRGRDHQRGAGGGTVVECLVDADVGGVARPEVVAGEDHQPVVGSVPELFGEGELRRHAGDAIGQHP